MLKLINFNSSEEKKILTFSLSVDSTDYNLSLIRDNQGVWKAELLTEVKPTIAKSPDEAVKELGRQLFLISDIIAQEDGNFGTIDLSKVLT